MRISESLKTSFVLFNLNRAMERMIKTQEDLSTSKRIHKPSDDPSGLLKLMKLKRYKKQYERYQRNVEDGYQWFVTCESSLNDLQSIITEVNSVLIQGNNDTLNETQRENLSEQLWGLWEQVFQVANQKHGDRYIYGGTNDDTPPYTKTSDVVDESFNSDYDTAVDLENVGLKSGTVVVTTTDGLTTFTEGVDYTIDYNKGKITVISSGSMADGTDYLISYETEKASSVELNPNGVDGAILRKIDEGYTMQINVSAEDVFGSTNGLMDVIRKAYNAFQRGDRNGIQEAMGQIENSLTDISKVHAGEIGVKLRRLEDMKLKIISDISSYEKLISSVGDADIAAAVVKLHNDQYVYEAALRTGSNLIQRNLLDYLK